MKKLIEKIKPKEGLITGHVVGDMMAIFLVLAIAIFYSGILFMIFYVAYVLGVLIPVIILFVVIISILYSKDPDFIMTGLVYSTKLSYNISKTFQDYIGLT